MSVRGFRSLQPIVRKTRTKVRIIKRCGMPFLLHKYRKRKMFFAGIAAGSFLIYLLSLFIWDIQFEGNSVRTKETLLEFLETKQLHHGVRKSTIDCEKVEAMLRNEFDDIIWASVEIKGTRLIVHVQESLKIEEQQNVDDGTPSDLCASVDGTVEKIITRSGTPLVASGEAVSRGAVLVQGRMDITGDSGEVVNYQYCPADADIYIRTQYPYEDTFSRTYTAKKYVDEPKKNYYIKTFSKRWMVDFFEKAAASECETVLEEKQLHLWNNFYLPFYFGSVTKKYYENEEKLYTEAEAQAQAEKNLQKFCNNLQKKGVQIVENNVTIQVDEKQCTAYGALVVIEKMELRQPTQILEIQQQEENDEHNGAGT